MNVDTVLLPREVYDRLKEVEHDRNNMDAALKSQYPCVLVEFGKTRIHSIDAEPEALKAFIGQAVKADILRLECLLKRYERLGHEAEELKENSAVKFFERVRTWLKLKD